MASPHNAAYVRGLGAAEVFNHRSATDLQRTGVSASELVVTLTD